MMCRSQEVVMREVGSSPKIIIETGRVWATNVLTHWCAAESQMLRMPSSDPDSQYLPPGETVQADSGLAPARAAPTGSPEAVSHRRRWASQPAESTELPSGVKAQANTSPWWPLVPGPAVSKRSFGTTSLPPDVHDVPVQVATRGREWHLDRLTLKHSSRFFSRGQKCAARRDWEPDRTRRGSGLSPAGAGHRHPRKRRP